jgi:hypothetical protein
MAETFRTTISAVCWSETTDESDAIVADVRAQLPPEDQAATLVTVEYISGGRPQSSELELESESS